MNEFYGKILAMVKGKIEIHTDGSCLGNPGPGGWAVVIGYNDKQTLLSGGDKNTTNNRMEMMAIISALDWAHKNSGLTLEELHNTEICLYSDSNLLMQTLNLGWKRKANLDLWIKIDKLRSWLNIKWIWVKGHASNKLNNLADKLAQSQALKFKRK